MNIESHINESELLTKIHLLFEYRLFPDLFRMKEPDKDLNKSEFYIQLVQLQKFIYYLDAHLEANAYPDTDILQYHWNNIYAQLSEIGIEKSMHKAYTAHIHKYQKHELDLRILKSPLRFSMEYFYFYKSCDVKLIRRLIYEKLKLFPEAGKLSHWRYYDLITEINDDVDDVFEDLQFYNGNRFLISLIKYGHDATFFEFERFIHYVHNQSNSIADKSNDSGFQQKIKQITNQRINETLRLLEQRRSEINKGHLNSSVLFKNPLLQKI